MSRQTRHDDIVPACVQFVSKTHELLRTCRYAVIKDRRDRPNLPVQKELGATFLRDAAMVPMAEALD